MTNRRINNWPQVYARIGGVLYLFNILAGLFGEVFVRNNLIVAGDAFPRFIRLWPPTSCFAAVSQATCST